MPPSKLSWREAYPSGSVPLSSTYVPKKSTLRDRTTGRVVHGKKNGPDTKLTEEDEAKLAAYLIETSKQGYGKSKEIIMFMATQIAKKRGKKVPEGGLSEMWWRSFLKRHPEISLRSSQNFGLVRTLVSKPTIEAFYDRLLNTMLNNGGGSLVDKPHLIFNADESGIEFDAINKIVAAKRGAKHVPRISKGQHEKVTVLACASASGASLPPMFIFKSPNGRVPYGVQEGAPEGTLFVAQKSGWIDKDLYLKWFRDLFLKSIHSERPVLLIVDGHKAHVTKDVIELAVRNNVLVFCLPAHASHLLQPLDLSLFGPLKKGWIKACAAFHHLTSVVVNQRNFAKIFNVAWHTSTTPDVIRSGFETSGIYPFDPKKFDYGKLAPSVPSAAASSSTLNLEGVGFSCTTAVPPSVLVPPTGVPFSASAPVPPCVPVPPTGLPFSASAPVPPCVPVPPTGLPFSASAPVPPCVLVPPTGLPFSASAPVPPCVPVPPTGVPVPPSAHVPVPPSHTMSPSALETPSPFFLPYTCADAFGELERQLGREQRDHFRRRYENGFDVTTDHTYNRWRELRDLLDVEVTANGGSCPCQGACSCTCLGIGFCDCIGSVVPLRPTLHQPAVTLTPVSPEGHLSKDPMPPLTPSAIQSPKEYTISTPTGDVMIDEELCSIMLRPAAPSRGDGKKRRKSLDPGNRCITGHAFLEAIRSETERKEREEEEKKKKKRERQRLAEEKKKQTEEKKKKTEEKKKKAEEKKKEKEKKREEKEENARKRKAVETKRRPKRAATRKTIELLAREGGGENLCRACNTQYVEDDDSEWVECDYCFSWFHVNCTGLPVLDGLDENVDYTCSSCIDLGYPSHVA